MLVAAYRDRYAGPLTNGAKDSPAAITEYTAPNEGNSRVIHSHNNDACYMVMGRGGK